MRLIRSTPVTFSALIMMLIMLGACQQIAANITPVPRTPTVTPPPTMTPTPTPLFLYYRVKRGDTLWSIANKYGVDVQILAEVNELDDPASLQLDQEILISERVTISGRYLPTSTPTTTPTPTPRPCTQGCLNKRPDCQIKGIASRIDGTRIYLLPTDSIYRIREADLWFCNEIDAQQAGWNRWTEYGPGTD